MHRSDSLSPLCNLFVNALVFINLSLSLSLLTAVALDTPYDSLLCRLEEGDLKHKQHTHMYSDLPCWVVDFLRFILRHLSLI